MCSAIAYVRHGPKADIERQTERPPRGSLSEIKFGVRLGKRSLSLPYRLHRSAEAAMMGFWFLRLD